MRVCRVSWRGDGFRTSFGHRSTAYCETGSKNVECPDESLFAHEAPVLQLQQWTSSFRMTFESRQL